METSAVPRDTPRSKGRLLSVENPPSWCNRKVAFGPPGPRSALILRAFFWVCAAFPQAGSAGWLDPIEAQDEHSVRQPKGASTSPFDAAGALVDDALRADLLKEVTPSADDMRQLFGVTGNLAPRVPADSPARSSPNTFVFISLGMPDAVLRALFRQARGRHDVIFLLRGWTPPHLTSLLRKVQRLLPDKNGGDINVQIHPQFFRVYGIGEVPVFLHRTPEGWHRLVGEISLDGAEEQIDLGHFGGRVGPTYALTEPDILDEIETRVAGYDWQGALTRARSRATGAALKPVNLPTASEDGERWVDPSIILGQSVKGAGGRLIAPKGTRVNPLERVKLSRPIAVFDADDEHQVLVALRWAAEHPGLLLLAERLPDPKGGVSISGRLGLPVYPMNSLLAQRLGVTHVPSLAEQVGTLLRITTTKP